MSDVKRREQSPDGQVIELGAAPGFPIVVHVAVHNGPISGMAASPDGTRLMVANYGSDRSPPGGGARRAETPGQPPAQP